MKLEVNADACISCGACAAIAPEVFEIEDIAKVILSPIPKELEEEARDAMEGCPTGAIYETEDIANPIQEELKAEASDAKKETPKGTNYEIKEEKNTDSK